LIPSRGKKWFFRHQVLQGDFSLNARRTFTKLKARLEISASVHLNVCALFQSWTMQKVSTRAAAAMLRDSKFHPINPIRTLSIPVQKPDHFLLYIELICFCAVTFILFSYVLSDAKLGFF
jgi:hypothetical protein